MRASEDIVTPRHFIEYLRGTLKLSSSQIRLPPRGVLVFGGEDFERFRRALRGRRASWSQWECRGRAGARRVSLARSMIGAPAAVTVLEEVAVRGVRTCVAFGACGSLLDDLPIGSVVIPTFAYPDDGTSRHYGAPRRPAPDPGLVTALRAACGRREIPVRSGGVWTTDAPYRESLVKARYLARRGVVAVEMEASALYSVARFRGLRVASLMVVSDELGGEGWNPGFRHPAFLRAKRAAVPAVVDTLARATP